MAAGGVVPGEVKVVRPGFTEPEPPKTETVEEPVGAGETAAAPAGQAGIDTKNLRKAPPAPGAPPSMFTAKGTVVPPRPEAEAQRVAEAQRRIFLSEQARSIAELEAMGVSEAALTDYANIGEMDAIEARRLHQEHFAQAKQRMDDLYREVDDARSLRVNPYNWHESIGRGGRVAAAFSMLTGQLAAGAGNPNSAMKLLDAAIERDISAQEQNIKNQFEALRHRKDISVQERQLYDEELNSLNKTRAIAYAAIQGRIQAAMQHAITEGHYQSLNVMKDHYDLKLLEALQAARAQKLRLEIEGPINASKLKVLQRQIETMEQQLTPGTPLQAEVSAPAAPTPEEGAVMPTAPGRAGAVAGRRGPPRVSVDVGDVQVGEEALEPLPEPAGEVEVGEITTEQPEPEVDVTRLSPRQVQKAMAGMGVPKHVVRAGGYGRAEAAEAGFPQATITGVQEAYDAVVAGRPIPNDGFADERDAIIFSQMVPPPKRENYRTQAAFEEALNYHKFNAKRYEVFQQEGVRNTIQAGGRTFRVRATSPAMRDDKRYIEVADKLAETQGFIRDLWETAQNYRRVGPTGGFFNSATGAFSIPGLTSTDPGMQELAKQSIQAAMGFIKANDPTARLSDKDLEVGEKAIDLFMRGKYKLMDIVQSLDGKYDNNTVRKSVEKYMQVLAKKAQTKTFQKFENELVPDYNTAVQLAEEAGDLQLWLNKNFEE